MTRLRQVLAALIVALILVPVTEASAAVVSSKRVYIESEPGVRLEAWLTQPIVRSGSQSRPLVVLCGSWNGQSWLDLLAARRLASRGYIVITYATRGAPGSGGVNSMAGPEDLRDSSAVIDWALQRTQADPDRIGVGGASYGAGLALLTAENDPRVRAVVALSGFGDLRESLYPNDTRNALISLIMRNTANDEGTTDKRFNDRWRWILNGWDIPGFLDLLRERSPIVRVQELNDRGTAVFLANTWNETAFPPDQLITFFNALTGPRRLELRPGEHISAETPARFGLDNDVWASVMRWFDRSLAPGPRLAPEQSVWLRARSSSGMRPAEQYGSWSEVGPHRRTYALGRGTLSDSQPSAPWKLQIDAVRNPSLNVGVPIVSAFLESYRFSPWFTALSLLNPRHFAIWRSAPLSERTEIRGQPAVRVTFTPATTKATIIVHLLDAGRNGLAYYVAHQPKTFRNVVPGQPITFDLPLRSTAYDVHPGHRLMLAVATWDLLYYLDTNPAGKPLVFSGGPEAPATLTLPLR